MSVNKREDLRILVIGGAGFIGSHLVYSLKDKYKITVADNLSLGVRENIPISVDFRVMSAGEISLLPEEYDIVFHLGIPSSSPMYKRDPQLVGKTINEMISVLEYCKKYGAKLVYASTSSIYNGNPLPFKEDMPIHVTDYYTECRYSIERLAKLYHKLYSVSSIGLRFFSVYGERERHKGRYANLVSQFLWAIMRDKQPLIYGDGEQTRDFVYVGDVVEALEKSMYLLLDNDSVCEIINVGRGVSHSLNELVEMINLTLGKDIRPKYVKNPIQNYVFHTLADTSKAEEILGFKARICLKKGIELLARFYGQL